MTIARNNPELYDKIQIDVDRPQSKSMKVTELVLDIETMPSEVTPELAIELYRGIEPTKIAIKDGKEAEYIKNKQNEIAEGFALSPMTGRLLGIGLFIPLTNSATYFEDTEKSMLEYLSGLVQNSFPKLITFNGKGFDIPFLKIRAAILGVTIPDFSTKKYDTGRHFDVREVLTNFGMNQKGTLKEWSIVFGCEPPKDSGKDIHLLTKEERQEKCLADCRCTNFIYQRLKNLF
jgi:DNA polymerase elongation subunit (family B)